MNSSISILIVDDHAIVRQGCKLLFEQSGFHVIGEVASGEDAYTTFLRVKPDVILLDISLNGMGGLETIRRIRAQCNLTKIVVFSMHNDPIIASRAMRMGANGYVTKTSPASNLIDAVQNTIANGYYLSQDIAQVLALCNLENFQDPLSSLTSREFEIFRLLVEGHGYSKIAEVLALTKKSVTNYTVRIRQKLGARNLADIINFGIKVGIKQSRSE